MKIVRREPDRGYLDSMLWLPKRLVNERGLKSSLTYNFVERGRDVTLWLWKESEHHILVPRCFIKELGEAEFDVVDCRPTSYPAVSIKSRIVLDAKNPERVVQRQAAHALLSSDGGILQLACIGGDTVLNLNRAGKGFRMTVRKAYERWNSTGRYSWDPNIPTKTRAFLGARVGLHKIVGISQVGPRITYTVHLADGKSLRVTSDHKILTSLGYRSLEDGLGVGGLVAVDTGQARWGKKPESNRKKKKFVYKRLHWYPNHPYAHKNGNKTGPRTGRLQEWCLEEHRAVAEADLNGLTLEAYREHFRKGNIGNLKFLDPAKMHVHHKNGDYTDNRKENLEMLQVADHIKHHSLGVLAFHYGRLKFVEITAVEEFGEELVYDISCSEPHHNFVANGIVVHNCGLGKTVIALHCIAEIGTPAIIHVDNMQLLGQWREEILRHLELREDDIGLIGDSVFDWHKPVVLATYQTIAYRAHEVGEEFRRWFGQAWWDEGHHVGAPTYCRGADLFYGKRFMLTATPYRDDGQHVIYDMHIGPVLYKDLQQELTPEIIFKWTGFELDLSNGSVVRATHTSAGEMHFGLLSGYIGSNRERLAWTVKFLRGLVEEGRKILVLSPSVAELANLLATWNGVDDLYTDIPAPTNEDVGYDGTIIPLQLTREKSKWLEDKLEKYWCPERRPGLTEIAKVSDILMGDLVFRAIENELGHRQKEYIDKLTAMPSNAGLMVYKVDEQIRSRVVKDKAVTFAVHKYGKEGLDAPDLDTVVACEPMSKQNAAQQFMGRVLRMRFGKKDPRVYVLVDNIGLLLGMSHKMQKLLRNWAIEDGGPYDYKKEDYPPQRQPVSRMRAFRR